MRSKTMKTQKENKKRLEILKSMMTSFVMTATVVIAIIVFIPKSPKAEILSSQSFYDAVTYQVLVTDEDMALDINTLIITLENQFETYTYPLSLGLNVGVFDQLMPNTFYQMIIYGSKGFGLEKLSTLEVKTANQPGGAIIGYELIDTSEYDLSYAIDILISDPFLDFSDLKLYYAYGYMDQEIHEDDFDFIEILNPRSQIELFDIPIYNTKVYLYIEAYLNGEPIILDQFQFFVPYHLETSLILESVTKNRVSYEFYKDYNQNLDAIYSIELKLGHQIVQTISNIKMENDSDYMNDIVFDKLKNDTEYQIIVKINYKDPYTLSRIEKVIHEETFRTLGDYQISYTITPYATYYEVYIYLNDPNHYFQIPYFEIYQVDEHHPIYLDGNDFSFTPDGNGKYATFTINKPNLFPYILKIGVKNQINYQINHIIFEEIIDKP